MEPDRAALYRHQQAEIGRRLAADRAALLRAADRLVAGLRVALLFGHPDPAQPVADLMVLRLLAGLDPEAVPPQVAGQPEADLAELRRAAFQHLSVVLPAVPADRVAALADQVAQRLSRGAGPGRAAARPVAGPDRPGRPPAAAAGPG